MNRFFRSGLLPLILIVLVVYLASSQLMGGSKSGKRIGLSEFKNDVATGQVARADFSPNKRQINFKFPHGVPAGQATVRVIYRGQSSGPVSVRVGRVSHGDAKSSTSISCWVPKKLAKKSRGN